MVDLILTVDMEITYDIEVDDEGNIDESYEGVAGYLATTWEGALVDEGSESDSSSSLGETAEDLLDEVALNYHRPYRF